MGSSSANFPLGPLPNFPSSLPAALALAGLFCFGSTPGWRLTPAGPPAGTPQLITCFGHSFTSNVNLRAGAYLAAEHSKQRGVRTLCSVAAAHQIVCIQPRGLSWTGNKLVFSWRRQEHFVLLLVAISTSLPSLGPGGNQNCIKLCKGNKVLLFVALYQGCFSALVLEK